MHPFAGSDAYHLLSELSQQHAALCRLRVRRGDADDVALGYLAVEAEQQVRRTEIEEMQRVRLQDLAVVHQPAYLFRGRCEPRRADHLVERLRRRQMVAHRANAAQALHHHRHLPVRTALDEALETAEFDDVQPYLAHLIAFVEQDRDFAVALYARDGVDGDAAQTCGMFGGFQLITHGGGFQS